MLILLTTLPNSIGNELHEFIRVICEIRNFILKIKTSFYLSNWFFR